MAIRVDFVGCRFIDRQLSAYERDRPELAPTEKPKDCDVPSSRHEPVSRARIERALQFVATIIAGPDGEAYLPIFERLEHELSAIDAKTDALSRARALVASRP